MYWGSNNITARKRSLGQGNMFTGVCLSTKGGGVYGPGGCLLPGGSGLGGSAPEGCLLQGGSTPGRLAWSQRGLLTGGGGLVETPRMATAAGDTHPTGMHSCCKLFQ